MASTSATGEVMRVVLPPMLKVQFRERCAQQGQNMSERMRQLIAQDVSSEATPAQRLSQILASAQAKNNDSGLEVDAVIETLDGRWAAFEFKIGTYAREVEEGIYVVPLRALAD